MTFSAVVPLGGYGGWSFLQRTMPRQQALQQAQPETQRDAAYFREKIGSITSAEDLVSDRRLLKVALGAFGLEGDLNNRYFIRKVLEGGTLAPDALANRLSDKQYLAFATAFGFGDFSVPNTQLSDFADRILSAHDARQFEIAVGDQSASLRLALNTARELPELAGQAVSEDSKWFRVMASAPLRRVFETAFGLPAGFGALDLDQQLGVFRDRAERTFGDPEVSQFSDPAKIETLLRRFLALSDQEAGLSRLAPGAVALQLLQGATGNSRGVGGVLALLV